MSNIINKEIIERIGVIREVPGGYNRELNLVSWNGYGPKLDIRDWSPDHDRCTKGITLTKEEAWTLFCALQDYFEAEEKKEGVA